MRKKIFCFSGIDGSGKSTHIALLTKRIISSEGKFKYVWFRHPKFFSYVILGLCRFMGLTKVIKHPSGTKMWETGFYMNKAVRTLWPHFQLIDAFLFWINKVYLPYLLGYIVFLDRSPVDTLVDVAYDVRNESLIRRYIGKLYRCILPSCTFSLIFDAEPGTAINRKDDEHDIQQLTIKRRLYRRVAEINGLQVINTKRPVDVVHNEVVQYVGVHIGNVAGATVQ